MTATSVERVNGTPLPAEPRFEYDPVAHAEAEAIRTRAEAEREALLAEAQGRAEAEKIKAVEEARKQKIANDKAEARAREEQAAREARIAESNRKRKEAELAESAAVKASQEAETEATRAAKEVVAADEKWRAYAIRYAIVCGIVSLPVQMSFFWNPHAPWMAAAPIMLEGAAWVVHRGARAAVANRRPVWHYRTIVWLLALIAAGVNLYHGLHSFDPGTALATAFASISGPGVWDLHEHGRIRKRDGVLTRRERRAAKKEAERLAAEKAAEEKRRAEEKGAAEKAAAEKRRQLAERRAKQFPKVWEHAEKLATDLGETEVTEAIWARAKLDVEGAKPGESAEVFRMRNAAELRVEAARQKKPVSAVAGTTNAQRVPQMMRGSGRGSKTGPKVRGVRRPGDTPKYHPVISPLASEAKRQSVAAKNNRANAN